MEDDLGESVSLLMLLLLLLLLLSVLLLSSSVLLLLLLLLLGLRGEGVRLLGDEAPERVASTVESGSRVVLDLGEAVLAGS